MGVRREDRALTTVHARQFWSCVSRITYTVLVGT